MQHARTPDLEIAYRAGGPPDGKSLLLLHGWPDDALTWEAVEPALHAAGWRTYAPWLRGYGATRFRDPAKMRSGQLSALGADVIALADALGLERFAVVGHDWGARAAYIAAALWPARVSAVVALSVGWGTNDPRQQISVAQGHRYWYHWYMATPRGKAAVRDERRAFARYIWDLWCPHWKVGDAEFERTAAAFDNPDWPDVTVHSYTHRWGHAEGDPAYADLERRLSPTPVISAPTLLLHGEDDPVGPPGTSAGKEKLFSGRYERKLLPGVGHFPQREKPGDVAREALAWLSLPTGR